MTMAAPLRHQPLALSLLAPIIHAVALRDCGNGSMGGAHK